MSNYMIVSGGSGQHGALAYLKLLLLCKDILADFNLGDGSFPYVYVFDKDKGAKSDTSRKTAEQMLTEAATALNYSVKEVAPTPILDQSNIKLFTHLLVDNPDLASLFFSDIQRAVQFIDGNFGQPAVGATVFYMKQFDLMRKDGRFINKDTVYDALVEGITNVAEQRIAHLGSAIGGTGSGVMPAALAKLVAQKSGNFHLAIPFLEWFVLEGSDDESRAKAQSRNRLIRQNRSSGLNFYLQNLRKVAAVLPLGYKDTILNRSECKRQWDGDFSQEVKESAIHLASALAMWEFYSAPKPIGIGMHSFTIAEDDTISAESKVGSYTLGSVLRANLILVHETELVCSFLKNPPDTSHVLFRSQRQKLEVPALRALGRQAMGELATQLEAGLAARREAIEWLKGLDFVDKRLKNATVTGQIKGVRAFMYLFPNQLNRSEDYAKQINKHLADSCKAKLVLYPDAPTQSASRLLPSYYDIGTTPSPGNIGTIKPIEDTLYIERLYDIAEIKPESTPSPMGVIHALNRVSFYQSSKDDELLKRYTLLLKGLIVGFISLKKINLPGDDVEMMSVDDQIQIKKSLGYVLRHLPQGEDQCYEPVGYLYQLVFKLPDTQEEVVLGGTSASILVFPSMSTKPEWWGALEERIKINAANIEDILAAWVNEIKQWDRLTEVQRPAWFNTLVTLYPRTPYAILGIAKLTPALEIIWNKEIKMLHIPRIVNPSLQSANQMIGVVIGSFTPKTFYLRNEEWALYSDAECRDRVQVDDAILVADDLLNLGAIWDELTKGEGVVDSILIEGEKNDALKKVIWCDVKEEALNKKYDTFRILCSDGRITFVYRGYMMVLSPKKFHGVTALNVGVSSTVAFEEVAGQYKFVDMPVKTIYAPLVESVTKTRPAGTGMTTITYQVKMKGRKDAFPVNVSVMITEDKAERGTIILNADSKISGWKAYYLFYDGQESLRKDTSLRVILKGQSAWELTRPCNPGVAEAVTFDEVATARQQVTGDVPPYRLGRLQWKDLLPRFLAVQKGGRDVGMFNLLDEKGRSIELQDGDEFWGFDFGTHGSLVAYYGAGGGQAKCLEMKTDHSLVILNTDNNANMNYLNVAERMVKEARWCPTYPSGTADVHRFVLTQLVIHHEIKDQSSWNNIIPGVHYQIPSFHADMDTLSREKKLVKKLKWPDKDAGSYRELRKAYLAMLMLYAAFDRVHQQDPKKSITPVIAYPLRMSNTELIKLREDFSDVCKMVENATGFKFNEIKSVSESQAASSVAAHAKEAIVADLGGATLDIWMGEIGDTKDFETDSILLGGIELFDYLAKKHENDVVSLTGGEKDDLEFAMLRYYIQKKYPEICDDLQKRSFQFKKAYSAFFTLIMEYLARLIAARIYRKNIKRNSVEPVLYQLILIGNGWKLMGYQESSLDNIPTMVAKDLQKRVIELLQWQLGCTTQYQVSIETHPLGEKDDTAKGTARSAGEAQDQQVRKEDIIRTYVGTNVQYKDSQGVVTEYGWNDTVPVYFGTKALQGKEFVYISYTPNKNHYPILPEIPAFLIDRDVYSDFSSTLKSAGDGRIYGITQDTLKLNVSPLGLLVERLKLSLNNYGKKPQ